MSSETCSKTNLTGHRSADRKNKRDTFLNNDEICIFSRNISALFPWNVTALLPRLVPALFLWNIIAYHLRNVFTHLARFVPAHFLGNLITGLSWFVPALLSRFVPTLFLRHIIALHRGHFGTVNSIAEWNIYRIALINVLHQAFSCAFLDSRGLIVLNTLS